MKKVLSVASEAVPLIKTGGLADVVGALPGALATQGWEMRTMIPAYPGILDKLEGGEVIWSDSNLFGGLGRLHLGKVGKMEVLALEAPHLYDRPGNPYASPLGDYWDNAERFAALCWVAAVMATYGLGDWKPDIVHAHDWQGALVPAYLKYWGNHVPSVFTIHNIAFQGRVAADKLGAMRLPAGWFHPGEFEFHGDISPMKAALNSAWAVTTVSPRYADELMRPEFGEGLDGVISQRSGSVFGILNGVDTAIWDPMNDPEIAPFSAAKMAGKALNRSRLLDEFNLDSEVGGPLAVLVSRLTSQKGIDLLPAAVEELVQGGGALCVLGSGEPWAETLLRELTFRFPGRVGVRLGYNEALSHRMFAGGDVVLVPSRFEPCGLTQLYGLRYGCLPLVSAVGGLADTVVDTTPATISAHAATGIVFHPTDALAFRLGMRHMVKLYGDRKAWAAMVRRAMKSDFGWERSAAAYAALYESLLPK